MMDDPPHMWEQQQAALAGDGSGGEDSLDCDTWYLPVPDVPIAATTSFVTNQSHQYHYHNNGSDTYSFSAAPTTTIAATPAVLSNPSGAMVATEASAQPPSTILSATAGGAPVKRAMACLQCYNRKVRCSGTRPCERCVKFNKHDQCCDRLLAPPGPRKPRRKKAEIIAAEAALAAAKASGLLPIKAKATASAPKQQTIIPPVPSVVPIAALPSLAALASSSSPSPALLPSFINEAIGYFPLAPTKQSVSVSSSLPPMSMLATLPPPPSSSQPMIPLSSSSSVSSPSSSASSPSSPDSDSPDSPPTLTPDSDSPTSSQQTITMMVVAPDVSEIMDTGVDAAPSSPPRVVTTLDQPDTLVRSASFSSSPDTAPVIPSIDITSSTAMVVSTARTRGVIRSASRSPVRKQARRNIVDAAIQSLSHHLAAATSPRGGVSRSLMVWDYTKIIRQSLVHLQRWICREVTRGIISSAGDNHESSICEWLSRATRYPMLKSCYRCQGLNKPCVSCALDRFVTPISTFEYPLESTPDSKHVSLPTQQQLQLQISPTKCIKGKGKGAVPILNPNPLLTPEVAAQVFSQLFVNGFSSLFWQPSPIASVQLPSFDAIPVPCVIMSCPQSKSAVVNYDELMAHHRAVLSNVSITTIMQDMMATRMMTVQIQNGDTTISPPSSLGAAKREHKMYSRPPESASGISTSASTRSTSTSTGIADDDANDWDISLTNDAASSKKLIQSLTDHFPVQHVQEETTGQMIAALNCSSQMFFSMTDETQRLVGYSRDELIDRISKFGWRVDLAMMASVRDTARMIQTVIHHINDDYALNCHTLHVVTKWSTVIKVSWIIKIVVQNGYRSWLVYMVPTGEKPDATHPWDPIFE